MKKFMLSAATMLLAATTVMAQQQQAAQAGPKPKSQKEVEALQKVQQAANPEDRIKAIDNVLENFADTEYKSILLQMAVESAARRTTIRRFWSTESALCKPIPRATLPCSRCASATVQNTKEFDLDKDQKLAKVQKYANGAIERAENCAISQSANHRAAVGSGKEAADSGSLCGSGRLLAFCRRSTTSLSTTTRRGRSVPQSRDPGSHGRRL